MPTSKPNAGFRLKRGAAGLGDGESFMARVDFVALRGMANSGGGFSKPVQKHLQTPLSHQLHWNLQRKRSRHTLDGTNVGGVARFAFFNLQLAIQVLSGRGARVEAPFMFLAAMPIV